MNFPVYKSETQDGLEQAIAGNLNKGYASVNYCSEAKPSQLSDDSKQQILDKIAKANSNPNQFDLFYLDSVLVSVGWNQNDDVFDAKETWAARNTPVDKQFNFMHDETDIIGHMTASALVDEFGNKIDNSLAFNDIPNKFDIVASSVLYRSWSNDDLNSRMEDIIKGIAKNKWFVSMECLFKNFDYALIDKDGSHKIIARNEESAFLSKHLRVYGGSGEFDGNKVGRLLRKFTFSGKGLVSNPANPRSIIYNDISPFQGTNASTNDFMETSIMEDQIKDLKTQLEAALKENKTLVVQVSEAGAEATAEKMSNLETEVTELRSASDEAVDLVKSQETTIAELEQEVQSRDEKIAEFEKQVADIVADNLKTKRLSALVNAGADEAEASELFEKFVSLDDSGFESVIELVKAGKHDPKDEEGEANASDNDDDSNDDNGEASAESDVDNLEGNEADLSANNADENADIRAEAANWIKTSVLKTTANLKN